MINKNIDIKFITHSLGYPNISNIQHIVTLLKGPNLQNNIIKFTEYIDKYGFSLSNIITELTHDIYDKIITKKISFEKSKFLTTELKDIEFNLCNSPNINIQISTIASIFYLTFI